MRLIAIEWAGQRVRWTADGHTLHRATSLSGLAERLSAPHTILCRQSFYESDPAERAAFGQVLAAHGHTLVGVSYGALTVLEAAAGGSAGSPTIERLYRAVLLGCGRLDYTASLSYDWRAVRDALDVACAVGGSVEEEPTTLAIARVALGPYAGLDDATKVALGDGGDYDPDLLRAIALAAAGASSRTIYERFLGLSAGSRGGYLRRAVHAWYVTRNTGQEGFQRQSVLTWAAYRRALRWAYHRVAGARRGSLVQCA